MSTLRYHHFYSLHLHSVDAFPLSISVAGASFMSVSLLAMLLVISSLSGVMKIFVYKGLTRNMEIVNTPVHVFPNIWKLRWDRDTKFGTNVSNKMFLNAAKCQGYSFYCFCVSKKKPAG